MSSVEDIPISHEEYRSGKYKTTSSSGGEQGTRGQVPVPVSHGVKQT